MSHTPFFVLQNICNEDSFCLKTKKSWSRTSHTQTDTRHRDSKHQESPPNNPLHQAHPQHHHHGSQPPPQPQKLPPPKTTTTATITFGPLKYNYHHSHLLNRFPLAFNANSQTSPLPAAHFRIIPPFFRAFLQQQKVCCSIFPHLGFHPPRTLTPLPLLLLPPHSTLPPHQHPPPLATRHPPLPRSCCCCCPRPDVAAAADTYMTT